MCAKRKCKPVMVPVQKLSKSKFAELSGVAEATCAQVPKITPAIVPFATMPHSYALQLKQLHDNPNSAFDEPKKQKEKKKKWRIYRMVVVKEFRATKADAQKELDNIDSRRKSEGVIYWLNEVLPKRPKPIRC